MQNAVTVFYIFCVACETPVYGTVPPGTNTNTKNYKSTQLSFLPLGSSKILSPSTALNTDGLNSSCKEMSLAAGPNSSINKRCCKTFAMDCIFWLMFGLGCFKASILFLASSCSCCNLLCLAFKELRRPFTEEYHLEELVPVAGGGPSADARGGNLWWSFAIVAMLVTGGTSSPVVVGEVDAFAIVVGKTTPTEGTDSFSTPAAVVSSPALTTVASSGLSVPFDSKKVCVSLVFLSVSPGTRAHQKVRIGAGAFVGERTL